MSRAKIGFIGAGHMAGAFIKGMVHYGEISPSYIGVYDLFPAAVEKYRKGGYPVYDAIPALVADCKVVFLTVKPQNIDEILPAIKEGLTPDTILVSVAAGVTAARIQGALGPCKLILAMPNTPIELGQGAVALGRVDPATQADVDTVKGLLANCSLVEEIPPDKMEVAIPVNGSSPAFAYQMAAIVMDEAARMGLDGESALRLFAKTLMGSAAMLLKTGDPQSLVAQVATPGGTTAAALKAMEEGGFDTALRRGIQVCVERARELNQSK